AFVACIYFLVAVSVISTGLLDHVASLPVALGIVAGVLVTLALATAAWQLAATARGASTRSAPSSGPFPPPPSAERGRRGAYRRRPPGPASRPSPPSRRSSP